MTWIPVPVDDFWKFVVVHWLKYELFAFVHSHLSGYWELGRSNHLQNPPLFSPSPSSLQMSVALAFHSFLLASPMLHIFVLFIHMLRVVRDNDSCRWMVGTLSIYRGKRLIRVIVITGCQESPITCTTELSTNVTTIRYNWMNVHW